jgi:hypothetical protein
MNKQVSDFESLINLALYEWFTFEIAMKPKTCNSEDVEFFIKQFLLKHKKQYIVEEF